MRNGKSAMGNQQSEIREERLVRINDNRYRQLIVNNYCRINFYGKYLFIQLVVKKITAHGM